MLTQILMTNQASNNLPSGTRFSSSSLIKVTAVNLLLFKHPMKRIINYPDEDNTFRSYQIESIAPIVIAHQSRHDIHSQLQYSAQPLPFCCRMIMARPIIEITMVDLKSFCKKESSVLEADVEPPGMSCKAICARLACDSQVCKFSKLYLVLSISIHSPS